MANVLWSINGAKVHKGTGYLWYNVFRPPAAGRVLIDASLPPQMSPLVAPVLWAALTAKNLYDQITDSNGNIQQCISPGTTGTPAAPAWPATLFGLSVDATVVWMNLGVPFAMGAEEGAIHCALDTTIEKIGADQLTAPMDSAVTSEAVKISAELKQTDLNIIARVLGNANLTSGTDTGLPTGAQTYTQITGGGVFNVPKPCIAVVVPKRQFSTPSKSYVFVMYAGGIDKPAYQTGFTRTKEALYKVEFDGYAVPNRAVGDQLYNYYEQT